MPKRPFFVMPDGVCVPLEGEWRIVELRGDSYVIGHHSVVPCGSRNAASSMLAELQSHSDADHLAAEAIHRLDQVSAAWEIDSLGESESNR
ncbi:MAG: hypothetical protein ABGX04_17355 [Myxococcales bacterium]|nr:hypothetical protein [Myxococcales bacterium]HIK86282.1 hypothetical protein [Myxococcales bacterium]